jgi:hypothetical protein
MIAFEKIFAVPFTLLRRVFSFHYFFLHVHNSFLKKLAFSFLLLSNIYSFAQTNNEDYQKVIHDRSAKIVNSIGLTDSGSYKKVLSTIINQYYQLNNIQEEDNAAVQVIKKEKTFSKEALEQELKKQEEKKSIQLMQLHGKFIALLKRDLTNDQVEKVKDGITYRILPITYAGYQDMIPSLTKEQKEKIYDWLLEARELAMDAGSSEKKHAVFGKYKGRINNYLSAAGYDLKKEGNEWEKRRKANAATSAK